MRGLLLSIAALAVLAVAAIPAHASVTPVNSAVNATSTNSVLTDEGTGLRTRCPLSTFTGRTSADGRALSGSLTFTSSGGVTCTENLFGSSVDVRCSGTVTLRSTSSVAGSSASGNVTLDSGFRCDITSLAGRRTITGPQTPSNCSWTFTPPSTLITNCNTIVTTSGEAGFAGTYRATQRFTIS
jgi:hypothetical protein